MAKILRDEKKDIEPMKERYEEDFYQDIAEKNDRHSPEEEHRFHGEGYEIERPFNETPQYEK